MCRSRMGTPRSIRYRRRSLTWRSAALESCSSMIRWRLSATFAVLSSQRADSFSFAGATARRNTWVSIPAQAAFAHVPPPDLGRPGDPGPFSLADADRLRQVLRDAGFTDIAMQEVVEQIPLGHSVEDTLAFIRRSEIGEALMSGAESVGTDPGTTERAWDAVRKALEAHASLGELRFTGTAWLVTARRPAAARAGEIAAPCSGRLP